MTRADQFAMRALALVACLILAAYPQKSLLARDAATAQSWPSPSGAKTPGYVDLVDHVLAAPLVIIGAPDRVKILRNGDRQTPDSGPGRALVRLKVRDLIRGEGGVAPELFYLVDLPLDPKGRPIKPGKRLQIIFARPATPPGSVQLVSRNAQMPWSPALEESVRAIVAAALAPDAPPRVTGVGEAFHNPGTIEGEGETQIFLKTENGAPISLSLSRQAGQEPVWGVSLGEIVGDAAKHPRPDSLLWYRLACALPPRLPPAATRSLGREDVELAGRDYILIVRALGTCARTL